MRPDRITISLEEKFTADQKSDIARDLAASVAESEQITNEKKDSDKAFNARISEAETKVRDLAAKYNKGCEVRQVDCKIRYNVPDVGKKSYLRIDTEEIVETRDMSPEERQEDIQFPPAPKESVKPPEPTPTPEPKAAEITFRYIQDIAATITTLPIGDQTNAVQEMADKISPRLLEQGKITDRHGKTRKLKSLEAAKRLIEQWLTGCLMAQGEDNAEDGKSLGAGA